MHIARTTIHIAVLVSIVASLGAPLSLHSEERSLNNAAIIPSVAHAFDPAIEVAKIYAQAYQQYSRPQVESSISCGFRSGITGCFAVLVNIIFSITGWFVGAAGLVLNYAVLETVVNMGENVRSIGTIEDGWSIFRDIANIVIIFLLLAIGIATILQVESYGIKKILPLLIIVALLINFSLLFTRLIIDTGNLFATQFYNQLETCTPEDHSTNTADGCASFSERITNSLKLTTLYDVDKLGEFTAPGASFAGAGTDAQSLDAVDIILVGLMGILLFVVVFFIFFAAALLLIIRFVVLIFLMILAPLAFVFFLMPKTKAYATKWWDKLINYTLFAPMFFLLVFVALSVIESPGFQSAMQVKGGELSGTSLTQAAAGDVGSFIIFLNFMIVTVFMFLALYLSKELSIAGGQTAVKLAGRGIGDTYLGGAGFIGRRVFGGASLRLRENERVQRFLGRSRVGRGASQALEYGSKASYDLRNIKTLQEAGLGKGSDEGGAVASQERAIKRREDAAKRMSTTKMTGEEREREKTLDAAVERARRRTVAGKHAFDEGRINEAQFNTIQNRLTVAQEILTDHQKRVASRGEDRKLRYAAQLAQSSSSVNRAAAEKIRKSKTNTQTAMEALKKEIKDEER